MDLDELQQLVQAEKLALEKCRSLLEQRQRINEQRVRERLHNFLYRLRKHRKGINERRVHRISRADAGIISTAFYLIGYISIGKITKWIHQTTIFILLRRNQKALYHASRAYSKATTRLLAHKIRTQFPRELRDLIYRYLWDPVSITALSRAQDTDASNAARKYPHCFPHQYPHFVNPHFMGREIAAEILDVSRYRLDWREGGPGWPIGHVDIGSAGAYINNDVLGLGLSREEIFGKERLEIQLGDVEHWDCAMLSELLADLDLLPLRHMRVLTFSMHVPLYYLIGAANKLRCLRTPYLRLLERGHRIEIEVCLSYSQCLLFPPGTELWSREQWARSDFMHHENGYYATAWRIIMEVLYGIEGSGWAQCLEKRT